MRKQRQQLSRERQAHVEVGRTVVGRRAALILSMGFLALVLTPSIVQIAFAPPSASEPEAPGILTLLQPLRGVFRPAPTAAKDPAGRVLAFNRRLLRALHVFEDDLEDASIVGRWVRPRLQLLFAAVLGVGNEQAYVGRQGRLYYRADIESVTAPGFLRSDRLAARVRAGDEWETPPEPDPRPAIRAFHSALAGRGIRLVLMPTPGKPTSDPSGFTFRDLPPGALPRNADFERFASEMEAEGIIIFDPAAAWNDAGGSETDRYLKTDTHWRPETMRETAAKLAGFLRERVDLPDVPPVSPRRRALRVTATGDLTRMLDLPEAQSAFPPETVTIEQVLDDDGQFWRSDPQADILLLGDSFSNIYAFDPLGWGESAGLPEHLALALNRPLDRIVRNDAGAHATRAMLAAELARGRDRLAGKRVVIWQFSERELTWGDWKVLPVTLGTPGPSRFVAPEADETITLRGVVQEIAPAPRPGTVPYRDHIVAAHLVELEHPRSDIGGAQALVYLWSMRDNVWTRAARLRPGETVSLRLTSWEAVPVAARTANRAELDDWALQLETPGWGEFAE